MANKCSWLTNCQHWPFCCATVSGSRPATAAPRPVGIVRGLVGDSENPRHALRRFGVDLGHRHSGIAALQHFLSLDSRDRPGAVAGRTHLDLTPSSFAGAGHRELATAQSGSSKEPAASHSRNTRLVAFPGGSLSSWCLHQGLEVGESHLRKQPRSEIHQRLRPNKESGDAVL